MASQTFSSPISASPPSLAPPTMWCVQWRMESTVLKSLESKQLEGAVCLGLAPPNTPPKQAMLWSWHAAGRRLPMRCTAVSHACPCATFCIQAPEVLRRSYGPECDIWWVLSVMCCCLVAVPRSWQREYCCSVSLPLFLVLHANHACLHTTAPHPAGRWVWCCTSCCPACHPFGEMSEFIRA